MTVRLIKLALSDFGATAATGVNLTNQEVLDKTEVGPTGFAVSGLTRLADVCHDYSGNLYICDDQRHVIVKVAEGGEVRWVAGSRTGVSGNNGTLNNVDAAAARFNAPIGIACDKYGTLYIADSGNNQIRTYKNGKVNVLAGTIAGGFADGNGTVAAFSTPTDVAVDKAGTVYVADTGNHAVRKIHNDGSVVTIAGNGNSGNGLAEAGTATAITSNTATWPSRRAMFNGVDNVAVDLAGNVYVWDAGNRRFKKITPDGQVHLFSGNGTQGLSLGTAPNQAFTCQYNTVAGIDPDESGNIFVADRAASRGRIVKIDFNGKPSVVADFDANSYTNTLRAVAATPGQALFVALT